MLYKKDILTNFTKFTGKHVCQSLAKEVLAQVLSCEFCKIFKNTFSQSTSGWLLLLCKIRYLNLDKALLFFSFFFFLSFAKFFYIVFYLSYVSICKDLQKTIVLSSGPFLQVFTFTIQCICNLWWSESSPSEAIP